MTQRLVVALVLAGVSAWLVHEWRMHATARTRTARAQNSYLLVLLSGCFAGFLGILVGMLSGRPEPRATGFALLVLALVAGFVFRVRGRF